MTLHVSTGTRNQMLVTNPLKTIFAAGFIKLYSGAAPSDADQAVTGTLLCTISISSGGTGINFDTTATAGVLNKAPAETWSGVNAATGTASYYRHVAVGDTGVLSLTQPRLQGDIATSGQELNLSSVGLTSGATQTIDFYSFALPTL